MSKKAELRFYSEKETNELSLIKDFKGMEKTQKLREFCKKYNRNYTAVYGKFKTLFKEKKNVLVKTKKTVTVEKNVTRIPYKHLVIDTVTKELLFTL